MPVLAIGAVDAVLFIAALFALLMLFAGWVVFTIIESVLSHVPIIGGYVGHTVTSYLSLAMQEVVLSWDTGVKAVAHFFWMLSVGAWHIFYQSIQAIADAKQWAVNAYNEGVAAGTFAAAAAANALVQADTYADNRANEAVSLAEAYADSAISTVHDYATAVGQDVLHDAESLYNEAIAYTDSAVNTVHDYATNVGQDVLHDAESLYNEAHAYADSLFGTAEADITSVRDLLNSDIDQLTGELDTVSGEIAALATTGALAGVIAQVEALTTEVTECVEPLCDTVTPNANELGSLGSLLSALDQLFDAAVLTALISEAVANPQQAATDVVTTCGWLSNLGVDLAGAFGLVV